VDEQEKEHQVCTKPAAVILTGSLATSEQRQKTKKTDLFICIIYVQSMYGI